jgi:hypothetical protein
MILNKQRFRLPYLGKEGFRELQRIGIGYRGGVFYIRDFNNAEKIAVSLSNMLNEDVIFTQTCLICQEEFQCLECKFNLSCPSRDLPFICVCKKCYRIKDLYDRCVRE